MSHSTKTLFYRLLSSKILVAMARVTFYLEYTALTLQSTLIECRYQLNCVVRDPPTPKAFQELTGTESECKIALSMPP